MHALKNKTIQGSYFFIVLFVSFSPLLHGTMSVVHCFYNHGATEGIVSRSEKM